MSNYSSNEFSHSHSCNDKDYDFDNQLDKWGVERLFQSSEEVITIKLKVYIEDREKSNTKNKIQLLRTMFMEKYGRLALYDGDVKKRLIIDHEELQFEKRYFGL